MSETYSITRLLDLGFRVHPFPRTESGFGGIVLNKYLPHGYVDTLFIAVDEMAIASRVRNDFNPTTALRLDLPTWTLAGPLDRVVDTLLSRYYPDASICTVTRFPGQLAILEGISA
ncbi:hypothetical protein [Actinokineospora enzanensis]|uniref:hypothetical protein n=1 Tax=Actinokineospora enzanensis TaxID=155975 RepID=UPI0012EBFA19|nr:hypothetical protein [Actinokineospora enzanensis]